MPRDELPANVPIVVLASACWDTPARVNCHEIAERFARRGHPVLFVESTGLRSPALRNSAHDRQRVLRRSWSWLRGAHSIEPNLTVVSPLAIPWARTEGLRRLSAAWVTSAIRRAIRRAGFERPVLWAFLPTHLDALCRIDARLTVYHCVDHYAENPGVDAAWIEELETRLVRAADVVLASSRALRKRLGKIREDVELVENVADVAAFAAALEHSPPVPDDLAACGGARVVYVGNLARYRTDIDMLRVAAERLPEVSFVLIGVIGLGDVEGRDEHLDRLLARPNVRLLGAKPHSELPAYLRHCDVAVIPFLDNGHTRASMPLKLWEYLASGLPVVATDLPQFRAPEFSEALRLAPDPDSFARAVAWTVRDAGRGGIEERQRRSRLARAHGWPERMDRLTSLLANRIASSASPSPDPPPPDPAGDKGA